MTITRTAAMVLAGAAALFALTALYLFFSKPDLTFADAAGVEVSCDSVASSVEALSQPYLADRSYTLVKGDLDGDADRFVEGHCDRQRTTYTAGVLLTLCPAATLIVLSLFPWKVSREEEPTPDETDSTASERM